MFKSMHDLATDFAIFAAVRDGLLNAAVWLISLLPCYEQPLQCSGVLYIMVHMILPPAHHTLATRRLHAGPQLPLPDVLKCYKTKRTQAVY